MWAYVTELSEAPGTQRHSVHHMVVITVIVKILGVASSSPGTVR